MMTRLWTAIMALGFAGAASAQPLTTAFTYQGELTSAGTPATGPHDMRFRLYDAAAGSAQIGSTLCLDNVPLAAGRFAVSLDFGAVFAGQQRFVEIEVRVDTGLNCGNAAGFVILGPRQALAGTPNALFALNATSATSATSATTAATATNATQLNGQAASFYQNAANLSAGTIPDARLAGTYTGNLTLNNAGNTFSGSFTGGGAGLTGLNASNITTGTLNAFRLPAPLIMTGAVPDGLISGINSNLGGTGVFGAATATLGLNFGGSFETRSQTGIGLAGWATAAEGPTLAVFGRSSSSGGTGVVGEAVSLSGTTTGVHGISASTSGRGVFGIATAPSGVTTGGRFESSSTSGRGVFGWASADSGANFGVYGDTASTEGVGVRGRATATSGNNYGGFFATNSTSGIGVYGDVNALTGTTYGVHGEVASTSGRGVYGWATAGTGQTYGVFGAANSTGGTGVYGLAANSSGATYGVWGQSNGGSGRGVYGLADALSGTTYGVFGRSRSTSGFGLLGTADANSGINYGVYGTSDSPSGYGVYASGRLGAGGTKSFRIDHPEDPENKYLLHYSTESPEVLNAYSGTATLDGSGEVIVELPGYFARINRDPRYTLTAVGAPMPMLHIAQKIDSDSMIIGAQAAPGESGPVCFFRIAGGAPNGEVSWRIEAVRNDLWMRNRAAPVEAEKEGPERGTYQHPEFYGQPRERGMNHHPEREFEPGSRPPERFADEP